MFGEMEAPFFTLKLTPGAVSNGMKIRYYGTLTFTELNSWLYTTHSLGVGYEHQERNWGISSGIIGGGALSYPKFDDIYFNIMVGASINFYSIYLYTVVRSYFAADNAMQSAYALYYKPRYQGIEVGAAVKFNELYGTVFADFDAIQSKYGVKMGTLVNFTPRAKGHIWICVGATQWTEGLGGGASFMAMAGIKLFFVGQNINTDYTVSYEHFGKGGIPLEIDINNAARPRPPTPEEREWENRARANLLESENMNDFAAKYCCSNASEEELITVARWMARSLGEVAYANKVEEALMQWDFLNTEIIRIADATHNDILGFLKQYNQWYVEHGTYEGMPEELLNGIAICAGIHSTVAEFLRMNGINAIAISVNSASEPHVVTMAYTDTKTMLIDYGDIYIGPPNSVDEIVRRYGLEQKAHTYNAQIFTEDYIGTWVTPEGRLLHKTIGVDNDDELKGFFLNLPGY